jgi:hypothetical protein
MGVIGGLQCSAAGGHFDRYFGHLDRFDKLSGRSDRSFPVAEPVEATGKTL